MDGPTELGGWLFCLPPLPKIGAPAATGLLSVQFNLVLGCFPRIWVIDAPIYPFLLSGKYKILLNSVCIVSLLHLKGYTPCQNLQ